MVLQKRIDVGRPQAGFCAGSRGAAEDRYEHAKASQKARKQVQVVGRGRNDMGVDCWRCFGWVFLRGR